MASLRRRIGTAYFFACFMAPDGWRLRRSTKQTRRKQAQAVANEWERAAKLASEERQGQAQARQVLADIYRAVENEPLPSAAARDYLTSWAERRKADTSLRTYQAYSQVVRDFLKALGPRAEIDVSQLNRGDVARYRDDVVRRTSISTANKALKYLRVAFGAAWKGGFAQDNPAAKLDILKRRTAELVERRPFTLPELKNILGHASGERKGIVRCVVYTGQRLKDIARLRWNNVDLAKEQLRFVTGKTNRRMALPIASPLLGHLQTLPAGDDPGAPLFPNAFALAIDENSNSELSKQFHQILQAAGKAKGRSKALTNKGRGLRRTVNEISFHSLRHTATSLLKNAGVSEAVAMDIIGHDTTAISRHYTHVEDRAKRLALAKLPKLV